jgi:hypothetical protein
MRPSFSRQVRSNKKTSGCAASNPHLRQLSKVSLLAPDSAAQSALQPDGGCATTDVGTASERSNRGDRLPGGWRRGAALSAGRVQAAHCWPDRPPRTEDFPTGRERVARVFQKDFCCPLSCSTSSLTPGPIQKPPLSFSAFCQRGLANGRNRSTNGLSPDRQAVDPPA